MVHVRSFQLCFEVSTWISEAASDLHGIEGGDLAWELRTESMIHFGMVSGFYQPSKVLCHRIHQDFEFAEVDEGKELRMWHFAARSLAVQVFSVPTPHCASTDFGCITLVFRIQSDQKSDRNTAKISRSPSLKLLPWSPWPLEFWIDGAYMIFIWFYSYQYVRKLV